ncbi:unnamed protein product [Hermetia illucens]|uniref:Uncharacterized protein n=1 Tax=Hermetia illucens TaxID=343691 RepID=A0A7R8YX02_HERIL|nr:uncharacterized protein LOC119653499 [Hermetia illucens]CAD7087361.1 unnamed protein product [Hermetia illucens]
MWCSVTKVWVILILGLFIGSNDLNDKGSRENPSCPTCIEAKPLNLKHSPLSRVKSRKSSKPIAILLAFNTLSPSSKGDRENSEESFEILGKTPIRASHSLEKLLRPLIDNGDLESTSSEETIEDSWRCKKDELINILRSVLKKKEEVLKNKHGVIHGVLSDEECSEEISSPLLGKPEIEDLLPNLNPEEAKTKTLHCIKNIIAEVTEKGHESLGEIVKRLFGDLLKDLAAPFGDISKKLEVFKPIIEKIESEIIKSIKEILEKLSEGASSKLQDIVKDIIKKLIKTVIELLSPKNELESSDSKSTSIPDALKSIVDKIFDDLSNDKGGSSHAKLTSLAEIIKKLTEIPEKIEEKLIQCLQKIFKNYDHTSDLPSVDSVKRVVVDLIKDLLWPDKKIPTNILDLLKPIIKKITGNVHNAVRRIAESISENGAQDLHDLVKEVIKDLVKDVIKSIIANHEEDESHIDTSFEDLLSPSPLPEIVSPAVDKILEKLLPGDHDTSTPCERISREGISKHRHRKPVIFKPPSPLHDIGKKVLVGLKDVLEKTKTHSKADLEEAVKATMTKIGEDLVITHHLKVGSAKDIFKPFTEKVNEKVLECIKTILSKIAKGGAAEIGEDLKSPIEELLKHVVELFAPSSTSEKIPEDLLAMMNDIVEKFVKKGVKSEKPSLETILQKINPFGDQTHEKIFEPVKQILEKIAKKNTENIEQAVKDIVEKLIKDIITPDKSTPDHLQKMMEPIIKKVTDKIINSAKAMMEELAKKTSGNPEDFIKNAIKNLLKDIIESIPKPKIPTIGDILEKVSPNADHIESKILNSIKQLSSNMGAHGLENMPNAVKNIVEEFITNVASEEKSKLEDFKEKMEPIVNKFVPKILDVVYRLIEEHAKGDAGSPEDFIKHIIDDLKREVLLSIGAKLLKPIPQFGEILEKIIPAGDKTENKIFDTIKDVLKKIADGGLENIKDTVKNIVEKLIKNIISPDKSTPDHLQKMMEPIVKKVTEKIISSAQAMMEALAKKTSGNPEDFIKNAIKNLLKDIIESIPKPKIPTIGDVLEKMSPSGDHIESKILNSIKQLSSDMGAHGLENMHNAVKNIVEEFITNIASKEKSKLEDFKEKMEPLVNKFVPKILDVVYRLIEEHAKGDAGSPEDFIKHIIDDLKREVLLSIGAKLVKPIPQFSEILEKIIPAGDKIENKIIDAIKDILKKIADGGLENIKGTAKDIVEKLIKDIISPDKSTPDHLQKMMEPIIKKVTDKIISSAQAMIEELAKKTLAAPEDFIKNTIKNLLKEIIESIPKIPTMGEILEKLSPSGDNVESKIINSIKELSSNIKAHGVENVDNAVKNIIEEFIKNIVSPEQSKLEEFRAKIEPIVNKFLPKILDVVYRLIEEHGKGDTANPEDFMKHIIDDLKREVIESIGAKLLSPIPSFGKILEKIVPIDDEMKDKVIQTIKDIWKKIVDGGMENLKDTVKNIVKDLIESVIPSDKLKSEDFIKLGEKVIKDISEKIMEIGKEIIEEFLKGGLKDFEKTVKDLVKRSSHKNGTSLAIECKEGERYEIPEGLVPDELLPVINKIVEELTKKGLHRNKDFIKEITDDLLNKLLNHSTEKPPIEDDIDSHLDDSIEQTPLTPSTTSTPTNEKASDADHLDDSIEQMPPASSTTAAPLNNNSNDSDHLDDSIEKAPPASSTITAPANEDHNDSSHLDDSVEQPSPLSTTAAPTGEEANDASLNAELGEGESKEDGNTSTSTERNNDTSLNAELGEGGSHSSNEEKPSNEENNDGSLNAELGEGGSHSSDEKKASNEENNDGSLNAELGEGGSHNSDEKKASNEKNNDASLNAELGEGESNQDNKTEANTPSPGADDGSLNAEEGESSSSTSHESESSSSGEKSGEESEEEDKEADDKFKEKSEEKEIPEVIVTPTDSKDTYRVTLNIDRLVNNELKKIKQVRCECREGPIVNERCPLHSPSKASIAQAIKQKFFRKIIKATPIDEERSQSPENIILDAIKQFIKPRKNSSKRPEITEKTPEIIPSIVGEPPKPLEIFTKPEPLEIIPTIVKTISEPIIPKPQKSIPKPPLIIPKPAQAKDFGKKVLEGIRKLAEKLDKGEITEKQCNDIIHKIVKKVKESKDVGKEILTKIGQALASLDPNKVKGKGAAIMIKILSQLTNKFLSDIHGRKHGRHHRVPFLSGHHHKPHRRHGSLRRHKRGNYNFPIDTFQNDQTNCPTCPKSMHARLSPDHNLKRHRKGIWEQFLHDLKKPEKFRMIHLPRHHTDTRVKRRVHWGCGSCGSQGTFNGNLENNSTEIHGVEKVSARLTRDEHRLSNGNQGYAIVQQSL